MDSARGWVERKSAVWLDGSVQATRKGNMKGNMKENGRETQMKTTRRQTKHDHTSVVALRLALRILNVPQRRKVQQLVVHHLLRELVVHVTATTDGLAARSETATAVHAHLPCPVCAGRIVADEPALVVPRRLVPDAALELCRERERRQELTARLSVRTVEPLGGTHLERR